MSRLHPTLADGRPEGRIVRQACFTLVRVELLRRKAFAEFAALSAARAMSAPSAPVAPVAPVAAGKSRQRKSRSSRAERPPRASRSSLNPAWRGGLSEPINS